MTGKPDRYTALRNRIDAQAQKLQSDIASGKLASYACAMSPVSTIVHEIWITAEDLAAEFKNLNVTSHKDIISNPRLAALDPPHPPLAGHFDCIHYALEIAVSAEQS